MKIPWAVLDACRSSAEIAMLLQAYGIKGCRNDYRSCPLAIATGWIIAKPFLWWGWAFPRENPIPLYFPRQGRRLTKAEVRFVREWDAGKWQELHQ